MTATTPADRAALLAFLAAHGIDQSTLDHPPVFTVEEGAEIKAALPGGHTKNLFLKDAKGQLWLICALHDTRVDLKRTAPAIGAAKLSFGSPEPTVSSRGLRPAGDGYGRRSGLSLTEAASDRRQRDCTDVETRPSIRQAIDPDGETWRRNRGGEQGPANED